MTAYIGIPLHWAETYFGLDKSGNFIDFFFGKQGVGGAEGIFTPVACV
jgi:hypothetical protein